MPIKFRCEHCHQKLGIAHRKAGQQVQCPTCLQMVTVPGSDGEPAAGIHSAPIAPVGTVGNPLFEQSDFDDILKHPSPERAPRSSPAAPVSPHAPAWSAPLP